MRPTDLSKQRAQVWNLLLLFYSITKLAIAVESELQPTQAESASSCPVTLTSVRMEVTPLLLYTICQDNSSVVLRISCGQDVWFERVTGFCNSFDLNIGRTIMNHPLKSPSTFLDLIRSNKVLDTARVLILDSDRLNRYRISVWGQRNSRFILSIVRGCEGQDYDNDLLASSHLTRLGDYLTRKTGDYYGDTVSWPHVEIEIPENATEPLAFNRVSWRMNETSKKSLQTQQSWQEPHGNTENNPRDFHSDSVDANRLTMLQISKTKSQMHNSKQLNGGDTRWPYGRTSEMASIPHEINGASTIFPNLRVKKDSVSNNYSKFQDSLYSPTKVSPHALHNNQNNSIQGNIQMSKKGTDENHLSVSNKNLRNNYLRQILNQTGNSEKLGTIDNISRNKFVDQPNLVDVINNTREPNVLRKLNNSEFNYSFPFNDALGSVKINQDRMTRDKSSSLRHKIIKTSMNILKDFQRNRKSQEKLFLPPSPSLLSTAAQLILTTSNEQNAPMPPGNEMLRFYFTTDLTDKLTPASVLYPMLSREVYASNVKHSRLENISFTPKLNAEKNKEINTFQDSKYSVVSSVMMGDKHSQVLPRSDAPSRGIKDSVMMVPHVSDVSRLFYNSHELQASETITWSENKIASTQYLVYGTTQYLTEAPSSNIVETVLGEFLASEPFVYTRNDIETSETVKIHPMSVTKLIETSSQSMNTVPNGFLESEPFHFYMSQKATYSSSAGLNLETPTLLTVPHISDATLHRTERLHVFTLPSTSLPTVLFPPSNTNVEMHVSQTTLLSTALQSTNLLQIRPTSILRTQNDPVSSSVNSSKDKGHFENENEGIERDTFWPVVAALVVGIPSVIVFGIAITVFHRRRRPDPQKLFTMQTLRSANIDTSDSDMTTNNMRAAVS